MTAASNLHPHTTMAPPAASLNQLLAVELSLRSRVGYVALLLAAALMTTVVVSLWATEPALPARTHVGFAILTAIGCSWVAFAIWVLTHRRPLLAGHGIIAGRMAVAFTSVFVLGAIAVGLSVGGTAPYAAAAVGAAMLSAAVVLLVRAHRAFAQLTERRAVLERELGRRAQ